MVPRPSLKASRKTGRIDERSRGYVGKQDDLDQKPQDRRTTLPSARRCFRRRVHRLPDHPDVLDVISQLVDYRATEVGWPRQFPSGLERQSILGLSRLHSQIYALPNPNPDDWGLSDRAARGQEHTAAAVHPGDRIRPGCHRALGLEPPLVLAVQLPQRLRQPAAPRPRTCREADRLVRRRCRPRPLGGDHLDRLESDRLRHVALCRGDPVHSRRISTRRRWRTAPATGSACAGSHCR